MLSGHSTGPKKFQQGHVVGTWVFRVHEGRRVHLFLTSSLLRSGTLKGQPSGVALLRNSKTDPSALVSTSILAGQATFSVPYQLLVIRPPSQGSLFILQDGTLLSRGHLVSHLQEALSQAGIDTANFSGHSFRIGAAACSCIEPDCSPNFSRFLEFCKRPHIQQW